MPRGSHEYSYGHYWARNGESQGISGPKDGICGTWALLLWSVPSSPQALISMTALSLFYQLKQVMFFLEAKPPSRKTVMSYN